MVLVRELMTSVRSQVQIEDSLVAAINLMQKNQHSCVLVLKGAVVAGIFTERDLVGYLSQQTSGQLDLHIPIAQVMSTTPVCVSAETSLLDAIRIAQKAKVRQLPVLSDEGYLEGIVTQTDMINAYVLTLEEQVRLVDVNIALHAQTREDALLGIGNRRAMMIDLAKISATAERAGKPYAIALFDLDFFKAYNDHYGHVAGDYVLKSVAKSINNSMRQSDSLYRYGGEEFLLLMPNADEDGAYLMAERARQAVIDLRIPHAKSPYESLTISGGVASDPVLAVERLIVIADRALYLAKGQGRNRIGPTVDQSIKKQQQI